MHFDYKSKTNNLKKLISKLKMKDINKINNFVEIFKIINI